MEPDDIMLDGAVEDMNQAPMPDEEMGMGFGGEVESGTYDEYQDAGESPVTIEDMEKEEMATRRDSTMSLKSIDVEYYQNYIQTKLTEWRTDHEQYFADRAVWLTSIRDFKFQPMKSDDNEIHIPYAFTMAKALHARIYEIFSTSTFFNAESRTEMFEDKEPVIRDFMRWVWTKALNQGEGTKDNIDLGIVDYVEDGTLIVKWGWERWEDEYQELRWGLESKIVQDSVENELGEFTPIPDVEMERVLIDEEIVRKRAAGFIQNITPDNFVMPVGEVSVQRAPYVAHVLELTDDDIIDRARRGRFDEDVAEIAIQMRRNLGNSVGTGNFDNEAPQALAALEGVNDKINSTSNLAHDTYNHRVYEFYCKAVVKKDVDDEDFQDTEEAQSQVVFWYHEASGKILGWNYLHRLCPDGKRPFAKSVFIPAKRRAYGIGAAELLYPVAMYMDAIHRLKMDNGTLASLQWGVYQADSTVKPAIHKIRAGELVPVDDITNVKLMNFQYLHGFGENEEAALNGYGERLLAVNDVNMGNFAAKGVAGALRNATGANFVEKQLSVQLHPHLDRLATVWRSALSSIFNLYRERISSRLVYRVTGDDGRPIFGKVDRESLQGEYDFTIDVDLLGTASAEQQQRSTLMMQACLNPMFLQMGIVTPDNLYHLLENHLKVHGVRRIYQYITKPQGYEGEKIPVEARIYRIIFGLGDRIEDTVRMNEDHQGALNYLQGLQAEGNEHILGMLNTEAKVAAYIALMDKHQQMLQMLQQGNGMANVSGTQMPGQGGLEAIGPQGPQAGGSPLESPQGEVNGPVF